MELLKEKGIIFYNLNENMIKVIRKISKDYSIKFLRKITRGMENMTMEDIVKDVKGNDGTQDFHCSKSIVIFNGFNDFDLRNIVKTVRTEIGRDVILAVLTKNSILWTFDELYSHLLSEREWEEKNK